MTRLLLISAFSFQFFSLSLLAQFDPFDPFSPRAAAAASSGSLTNGTFETYTGTQDDTTTDDFTGWVETPGSGGGWIGSITGAHGGSSALAIHRASGNGYCTNIVTHDSNGAALTASTNYRLRFWTKMAVPGGASGRFTVLDYSNGGAEIVAYQGTGVTTDTWTEEVHDFATPSGCTTITIYFDDSGAAGETACYDDVTLVPN